MGMVVWGCLVLIQLALGGQTFIRALQDGRPGPGNAFATSDAYLKGVAPANASATLLAGVAALPDQGSLLVVGSAQDSTLLLTYYTVSYLTWPRRVGAIQCQAAGQPPLMIVPPGGPITAALFYRVSPPRSLRAGRELGPRTLLVPMRGDDDWTRFCSS